MSTVIAVSLLLILCSPLLLRLHKLWYMHRNQGVEQDRGAVGANAVCNTCSSKDSCGKLSQFNALLAQQESSSSDEELKKAKVEEGSS